MSDSTYQGFMVTLRTALDLCRYLTEVCGFKYLMTARLNQDALEVSTITVNLGKYVFRQDLK